MKIAIGQMEVIPGHPDLNFKTARRMVEEAKTNRADMLVLPELCLSGYSLGDMWEEITFVDDCVQYGEDLRELSDNLYIVFGNVAVDKKKINKDGRMRKYNALFVVNKRKFIPFINSKYGDYIPYHIKSLLPNYREFEEPRHFTDAETLMKELHTKFAGTELDYNMNDYFQPIDIMGVKIAFCICEEGWDSDYLIKPLKAYKDNGAELAINISYSPYTKGKNGIRNRIFGEGHAREKSLPLLYVNAVGIMNNAKTVFTLDGSSIAYDKTGDIIKKCPMFEEVVHYIEFDNKYDKKNFKYNDESSMIPDPSEVEEITMALEYGIKKYLATSDIKKIVIGLSGGIDSALTALLYTRALGPENVLLVNMPSKHNSRTTIDISEKIASNLGCPYISIPIEESVELTKKQIQGRPVSIKVDNYVQVLLELNLTPFDLENVQARDRSSRILAALSSAWKGVFTCNGNKSEMTVGYCTRYGDLGGFIATLGDLWKHDQIYPVAKFLNDKCHVFPESLFTLPPSPELSPEHNVDEGKGDALTYWYHDRIFQGWQQDWNRKTPEDHLRAYLDGSINKMLGFVDANGKLLNSTHDVYKFLPTVEAFTDDLERWYKLFKGTAVTKRVEAPPVLAINRRAYGFDYRETIGACYFTRNYLKMKGKYEKG
jgi:NAD+ synthase (glutamine-hydrolysing)